MKRTSIRLAIFLFAPAISLAGDLDREIENRWVGSWVVTRVESSSDCSGEPTRNIISNRRVRGRGRHRFSAGELARVTGVDFKRSQIRFQLSLSGPILLTREEGPFTLVRESACAIELEVDLPREVSRKKEVGALDRHLSWILGRFGSAGEARQSDNWNRRVKEAYPVNYESTLIEYAAWKLERLNERARSRFDTVLEKLSDSGRRVGNDPSYLAGFSRGARAARSARFGRCEELLESPLHESSREAARVYPKKGKGQVRESRAGYEDGYFLVYGVEFLRRLQGCFISPENLKPSLARTER